MSYTKEQRLDIGHQVYDGDITKYEAAEKYKISVHTVRDYMRLYRDVNNLPPRNGIYNIGAVANDQSTVTPAGLKDFQAMTKEELVDALVMSKITEARLKKGYVVKGVGANKQFIPIAKQNTK